MKHMKICNVYSQVPTFKGSGSCPECQVPLRRSNFRVQLFEDPVIEKEVDIRKRILRDYNKKEEDFATLNDYNDYLEQVHIFYFIFVVELLRLNSVKLLKS